MKFYYENQEIRSKSEWEASFPKKQWKKDHSAEQLAEDFMGVDASGESTIVEIIRTLLNTDDIILDSAIIEYGSRFDSFNRPRMQDLAIWGNAGGHSIFVGIEAKVDERFGSKSLSQQRTFVNSLIKKGTSTDAGKRLDALVLNYLNNEETKNGALRYQLLYYLAGSFMERQADLIIMPVIVYSRSIYYSNRRGSINMSDYRSFMDALGFEPIVGITDSVIELAYYKKMSACGMTKDVYSCYIVK